MRADTAFIRDVVAGNLLEVQLGNLAERKASNPAVKQFAQQMVKDHTAMEKQWIALGARNGVPVPALDPAGKQAMSQLEKLSGTEFDQAYMTSMVNDHQQTVNVLQQLARQAQSAEVRQLAASGLPTVQQHLTMAQQVGSQVGATTGVAVVPRNPAAATNGQVTNQNDKSSKDLDSDKELIRLVTEDHMWELRLNQMAQREGTDEEVKQFAQNMVNDFTRWQNRWEDLVVKSRMASRPGINHQRDQKEDQLQRASGRNSTVCLRPPSPITSNPSCRPCNKRSGRLTRPRCETSWMMSFRCCGNGWPRPSASMIHGTSRRNRLGHQEQ